jgi:hypothetical protein
MVTPDSDIHCSQRTALIACSIILVVAVVGLGTLAANVPQHTLSIGEMRAQEANTKLAQRVR